MSFSFEYLKKKKCGSSDAPAHCPPTPSCPTHPVHPPCPPATCKPALDVHSSSHGGSFASFAAHVHKLLSGKHTRTIADTSLTYVLTNNVSTSPFLSSLLISGGPLTSSYHVKAVLFTDTATELPFVSAYWKRGKPNVSLTQQGTPIDCSSVARIEVTFTEVQDPGCQDTRKGACCPPLSVTVFRTDPSFVCASS